MDRMRLPWGKKQILIGSGHGDFPLGTWTHTSGVEANERGRMPSLLWVGAGDSPRNTTENTASSHPQARKANIHAPSAWWNSVQTIQPLLFIACIRMTRWKMLIIIPYLQSFSVNVRILMVRILTRYIRVPSSMMSELIWHRLTLIWQKTVDC